MTKEQKKRLLILLIGVLVTCVISTVYIKILLNMGISYKCPSKEIFNIDCPGCGGTRMIKALLKGEIYQAFRYNPFVFITLPMVVILTIHQSVVVVKTGKLSAWLDNILITYAVALIVYGILRNIEAFSWLKPTIV